MEDLEESSSSFGWKTSIEQTPARRDFDSQYWCRFYVVLYQIYLAFLWLLPTQPTRKFSLLPTSCTCRSHMCHSIRHPQFIRALNFRAATLVAGCGGWSQASVFGLVGELRLLSSLQLLNSRI